MPAARVPCDGVHHVLSVATTAATKETRYAIACSTRQRERRAATSAISTRRAASSRRSKGQGKSRAFGPFGTDRMQTLRAELKGMNRMNLISTESVTTSVGRADRQISYVRWLLNALTVSS